MTTGPDWADQARRLLDSLRGAPADGAGNGEHASGEHGGGECRWCPHCQITAVLRGDRPEVTAVLADVLTTAVAALRQLAGEAPAAEPTAGAAEKAPAEDAPAEEAPAHSDPAPVVQRIEIA